MYNESLVLEYFERLKKEKIEYFERELKIEGFKGKAISIIGPRRAGKTYFLLHYFLNDISSLYLDMESIEFSMMNVEEFFKIIALYEAKYNIKIKKIFLDEVQNIKRWQSLIRTLLNRSYQVFITGSSSKLLSKEIATQLRGRTLSYLLLPFSFKEFLNVKKIKIEKHYSESEIQKIKILLREYMKYGSFPEVIFSKSKEKILKEYFDTIFYKDFVERHSLKSFNTARIIFEYLFQNFSKEISIEKIKNYIKNQIGIETKTTIYSYIDKLSDTFAVFFVDKYSQSIYKRKSWPKKVYVCDVGIPLVLTFSEDLGKKMENAVFLDLLRKTNENPLLSFYYWKDYQGREVDFVIKEGAKIKQLIQVSYASTRDEIDKREIKALLKASKELKCSNLLCITWDYEALEQHKGKKIKFLPLWKWLIG